LSFLPWAHSYGQTCELWCSILHGSSLGICRGVPHILDDLQRVKPTILFSVPTLYKKIFDGVNNLVHTSSPFKKKLMEEALQAGRSKSKSRSIGFLDKLKYQFYDVLVLDKIRKKFGGKIRHGFVAGAACPKEVVEFMDSIGVPLYEGYGLTETSPIITLSSPGNRKIGSVGKCIDGVGVAIVSQSGKVLGPGQKGEVCCYGPNIMRGYWNQKEETENCMSFGPDGVTPMFHTGDLGKLGEDGFLQITGRIKELYKLENGKYVSPGPIEEAIGTSRFISQVVLFGADRPYNIALLVLDWVAVNNYLKIDENLPINEEMLANNVDVKYLIASELQSSTAHFKNFEVPTKWIVVSPFTLANSMLTPKMSIRRHIVIKNHKDAIDSLYTKYHSDGGTIYDNLSIQNAA